MAKQSSKTWSKALGTVGKALAIIPDTTALISKGIEELSPIVKTELDRRHEHKQSLISLDDVRHLDITEAKAILENKGFTVSLILAQPQAKYGKERPQTVLEQVPKSGKFPPGKLVKLYYLDQEGKEISQDLAQKETRQTDDLLKFVKQVPKTFAKKDDQTKSR